MAHEIIKYYGTMPGKTHEITCFASSFSGVSEGLRGMEFKGLANLI